MKKAKTLITLMVAALLLAGAASALAVENLPDFNFITIDELKAKYDAKENFVLVDARNPKEYAQGHLPGAINVDSTRFEAIGGYLPKNKDILVITYCRGYR